jgi:hypothetical protein
MAQEYTQKQLEEMVQGKPIDPTIEFYEQAVLNVAKSKEQGKRVYRNTIMIMRRIPGVKDYVASEAKEADFARWPDEFTAYQAQVLMRRSPGLEVIPGISNIERQELIDRGYSTIAKLTEGTAVPAHLVHIQKVAARIHQAIQAEEIHHGSEEERNQEESIEESRPDIVPQAHRQEHNPDVGEHHVQEVQPGRSGEPAEGNPPGRQEHRGQHPAVSPIDNWKVDLTWSP